MLTVYGYSSQPQTVAAPPYPRRMVNRDKFTPQAILAQNLRTLLAWKHGPNTQMELARASKVGQATIGRLLKADAAARIETVHAIARAYDLEAWQLLVAGMDPSNPPVLMPVNQSEQQLYAKLRAAAAEIAALPQAPYKVDPE